VDAYVIGRDYFAARDALAAALRQAGPGELVHPYLGTLSVVAISADLSESTREGGMARFALEFVEAGQNELPEGAPADALVGAAAASAESAAEGDFGRDYATAGQPDFVADGAKADAAAISGAAQRVIANAPLLRQRLAPAMAAATAAVAGLPAAGILDPARIFRAVTGPFPAVYSGLSTLPAPARTAGLDRLIHLAAAPVLATAPAPVPRADATPARQRQAGNQDCLVLAARIAAAAAACRAALLAEYGARSDADQARARLVDALDALADAAAGRGWDTAWMALLDLRRATARALAIKAGYLPYLVRLDRPRPVASTLLSWALYGADPGRVVARGAELAARNRGPRPGFLGPTGLEALIDG
jgi:prophage DNA circulation protein